MKQDSDERSKTRPCAWKKARRARKRREREKNASVSNILLIENKKSRLVSNCSFVLLNYGPNVMQNKRSITELNPHFPHSVPRGVPPPPAHDVWIDHLHSTPVDNCTDPASSGDFVIVLKNDAYSRCQICAACSLASEHPGARARNQGLLSLCHHVHLRGLFITKFNVRP